MSRKRKSSSPFRRNEFVLYSITLWHGSQQIDEEKVWAVGRLVFIEEQIIIKKYEYEVGKVSKEPVDFVYCELGQEYTVHD